MYPLSIGAMKSEMRFPLCCPRKFQAADSSSPQLRADRRANVLALGVLHDVCSQELSARL